MIFENNRKNINIFINKIKSGEVVIFPTDTVFGIGCDATNTSVIEKIYTLKGRSNTKTFLLNFPNIKSIKQFANLSKVEKKLLKKFGNLTLIVNVKKDTLLSPLTIKGDSIGIRIPKNKSLQKILKKTKTPLISTSCNKSGNISAVTVEKAEETFPNLPILQNTEQLSGTPSTIVKIKDNNVEIIRQGSITRQQILDFIKNI